MVSDGTKGKLHDRLKKITLLKRKKGKVLENFESNQIYSNFLKIVAAVPLMVYDNIYDSGLDKKQNNNKLNNKNGNAGNLKFLKQKKLINKQNISSINISSIKKKQEVFNDVILNNNDVNKNQINLKQEYKRNNKDNFNVSQSIKKSQNIETYNNDYKEKLEKKIINLIKKSLIKMVNEYEIFESELYLLSQLTMDEKDVRDCSIKLDEIKKLLCKVDKLKNKYDFLKDNYDFEYMTETNDISLADAIILLKDQFSNNEVKATVTDYKLLDLYKFLYLRVDQLEERLWEYEENENKLLEKFKNRDIDFEKLKNSTYGFDKINMEYTSFVSSQNESLKKIESVVSKIDSHEVYKYRLKGFGSLLFSSFKYLGLLMLNPLKGFIPAIATETLITKNVVNNLYSNLEWEENKKIFYEAIDYSRDISRACDELDYTDRVVDSTLEDIVKLKIKYNEQFRKYQGDYTEYENVINKINDMENKILGNKIKIEIMRKRYNDLEKDNHKKLELVRDLNYYENNK